MIDFRSIIINKSVYLFLIWYYFQWLYSYKWLIVSPWTQIKSAYTIAGWITLGTLIGAAGDDVDLWNILPGSNRIWIPALILLTVGVPVYHVTPIKSVWDSTRNITDTHSQSRFKSDKNSLILKLSTFAAIFVIGSFYILISLLFVLYLVDRWFAIQYSANIDPFSLLMFTAITVAALLWWRYTLKKVLELLPSLVIWLSNRSQPIRIFSLLLASLIFYYLLFVWWPT